jgi:predicted TIM-barrel fold metal-dependent hydrolase
VRKHSADKILFGSDSPWSSQRETLEMVKTSGLTPDELNLILENNAAKLLNIVS